MMPAHYWICREL